MVPSSGWFRKITLIALQGFLREASILQSLNHRNVVGFIGILDDPDRMCIVMPWMHNGELDVFLKRNAAAPRRLLVSIPPLLPSLMGQELTQMQARQIAAALEYIHGQYIVHGDLKGVSALSIFN
jgi:serine/threonine protein kinase